MAPALTFVTPRYGEGVFGGAEQGARSLAIRLAQESWSVRVITSCATDHRTWANAYEPGERKEEGVDVLRCPVDRNRHPQFDALSSKLFGNAKAVSIPTALEWIDLQGPSSNALLEAVASVESGVLAFYPYLYQPTVRGMLLARVPSILHPACHREPAIELPIFSRVFSSAAAFAYHSRAEQSLVLDQFPTTRSAAQGVIGLPVEIDRPVEPERARHDLGLGDEPFVVALGRVDAGKGTNQLISSFARFRRQAGRGHLVLAGPVVGKPPRAEGVTVLGPVPHEHKFGLLAAADVLVNPSMNESFSTVAVEAMLVGTPILVNGWCPPLREHCINSGAGLWYTGEADFQAALARLSSNAELRLALGEFGRAYAERFFSWPVVFARYERLFKRLA